ncbi:MAG: hypothetical protein M0R06_04760 [Sphaerochaeta sp.]|nr:hypothetical protein [Sphaerochaeta sp.]
MTDLANDQEATARIINLLGASQRAVNTQLDKILTHRKEMTSALEAAIDTIFQGLQARSDGYNAVVLKHGDIVELLGLGIIIGLAWRDAQDQDKEAKSRPASFVGRTGEAVTVEWKRVRDFRGRVNTLTALDGEVLTAIPLADNEIVCDFCNASIEDFPCPVVFGHALCRNCWDKVAKDAALAPTGTNAPGTH